MRKNQRKREHAVNAVSIRNATPEDAEAIAEIYSYYVENTAITFEYTAPNADEIRARMANTMRRYPYLVAESGGTVLGYAYAGPFHPRAAYAWSAEVSIYISRNARHGGLGRRLYEALESKLHEMGILNIYACVAYPKADDEYLTHNSADFHEHLGFTPVGRFTSCAYKFGRWYDMLWMEKTADAYPDAPAEVKKYIY